MTARAVTQRKPETYDSYWVAIGREQWAICRRTERRALTGDVEALHDLRVALRRLRVWLQIMRMFVADRVPLALERSLRRTQKILGTARDADIVLAFLHEWKSRNPLKKSACCELKQELIRRAREGRRTASVRLNGPVWESASQRMESYLAMMNAQPAVSQSLLVRMARAAMLYAQRRVVRRYRQLGDRSPQKLHRLRIAVRRLRYICEFFAPLSGPEVEKKARVAKRLQDILGDIHDMDVVDMVTRRRRVCRRLGMTDYLRARKKQKLRQFENTWQKAQWL